MLVQADEYGLVGTLIADKYLIEDQVGSGGFGVVYRARHQIWEQPVAVKCFTALSNAPVAMRESLLEGFVQEGRLLSALSSRTAGIVQARDIGTLTTPTGSWLPYMVLEWLSGGSLNDYLRDPSGGPNGKVRDAQEAFRILDGAARALALAHAHGVAHRDIKPDNFFVCDGQLAPGVVVKVLDFGIAKVMQSQAGTAMASTGTQITSFTPNYGAPEQYDRVHGATGPWTDVFGLALVVLEVMSGGRPALSGTEFLQLAFASQNTENRPTPQVLGLTVSDEVEAVFARALAVKVVDRYPNVGVFWAAFAEALGITDYPAMPVADGPLQTADTTGGASKIPGESSVVLPGGHRPPSANPVTQGYGGPVRTGGTVVTADTLPTVPEIMEPPKGTGLWLALGGLAVAAAIGGVVYFAVLGSGRHVDHLPGVRLAEEEAIEAPPDLAVPVVEPAPELETCPQGMVEIEGGKFFMGSDARDQPSLALAMPSHQVEVGRYCLDRHEVTLAAYRNCSKTGECKRAFLTSEWPQSEDKANWKRETKAYSELCNESYDDRGRHPVNCVTWDQAATYCKHRGHRLPSEVEWEFAARGSDGRTFPWGDAPPDATRGNLCGQECEAWRLSKKLKKDANFYEEEDAHPGTAPVGSYAKGATQAGVMDMVGNVFEWTADPFHTYDKPDERDLTRHMIRGGGFNSTVATHADPALRFPQVNGAHTHGVGFRCAMTPGDSDEQ